MTQPSECRQVCELCKRKITDDGICTNTKCDAYNECPKCGYRLDQYNSCMCMSDEAHEILSGVW